MTTLPYSVARMITFDNMHPVTAWRYYYGMTRLQLAEYTNMSEQDVAMIENTNHHLMTNTLEKLSRVFGVVPEALNIRNYQCLTSN